MTTTPPRSSFTVRRVLLFGVAMIGMGAAGVLVGSWLRGVRSGPPLLDGVSPPARSLLIDESPFPAVTLTSPDGSEVVSSELVTSHGTVVLFLDLECPPCADMADKWNDPDVADALPGVSIFGVTNHAADLIDTFAADNGIRFPIYEDREHVFSSEYAVRQFPLEVLVDSNGLIRSRRANFDEPIDFSDAARLLASAP